ncbi:MAG: XdhC family protein [Hyphomicrobiaceae bacterium]|nr:XdhC family protein [Hyphomicrobiaceae bacterium]
MSSPHSLEPNAQTSDDVLPHLWAWRAAGVRVALLTLIGIDGGSPRPLGAQMAVAEDGRSVGYLSGGCLERSLALQAVSAIRENQSRQVRYGRGSPYLDIALPCGSGLDIHIVQNPSDEAIERAKAAASRRLPFALEFDLQTGAVTFDSAPGQRTGELIRSRGVFRRTYWPGLRLHVIGSGPAIPAIAAVAQAAGLHVDVASPDALTLAAAQSIHVATRPMPSPRVPELADADRFTAVVLAFHDHEREAPLLADVMQSRCFYIGALGSRAVHAARLHALALARVPPAAMARVRGPVGLIAGAKSVGPLAVGIVAEILAAAKADGLID